MKMMCINIIENTLYTHTYIHQKEIKSNLSQYSTYDDDEDDYYYFDRIFLMYLPLYLKKRKKKTIHFFWQQQTNTEFMATEKESSPIYIYIIKQNLTIFIQLIHSNHHL